MITSGSHTPGVDPGLFKVPPFAAIRYERPAATLRGLVSDYFVFDSEGPEAQNVTNWMLPTDPVIRLTLTSAPILVEMGEDSWVRRPTAAFYGPATRARRVRTNGGVTIGAGLTAAGVARLADLDLSRHRDGIVELERIVDAHAAARLVADLRASDQGPDAKPILDAFFLQAMSRPHRSEGRIRDFDRALRQQELETASDFGARLGLPPHTLRRLANRHFGFPSQTLIARTRFMRSLMAITEAGATKGYAAIDAAYFDTSHFLRDCKRFLGMTARQFMALDTTYLDVVVRARRAVIGTGSPILDKHD
jgi:AraC-like DNA-binding protein